MVELLESERLHVQWQQVQDSHANALAPRRARAAARA